MNLVLKKYLGVEDLPEQAQNFISKYLKLYSLYYFIYLLATSYIILDFIDAFDYAFAGILMAIIVGTQFVTDYPTGSLADYIGQRFVVILSLVCLGIGYIIISITDQKEFYYLATILFGIGLGQLSGAFESYLDTNYKNTVGNLDDDRKIYGFFYQRFVTLSTIIIILAVVTGGVISTLISREFLFRLEGVLMICIIPIIALFLKDAKTEPIDDKQEQKHNYFYHLRSGLGFFISSKKAFFLILSRASLMLMEGLWLNLIVSPFYLAYTGNDAGVGLYRSLLLFFTFFIQFFTAGYNKRIDSSKIGRLHVFYYLLFFPGLILLFYFVPVTNTFNPIGIIGGFIVALLSIGLVGSFTRTLYQRIISVEVPSEKRNSVYSLMTSLYSAVEILILPFLGTLIYTGGLLAGAEFLLILSLLTTPFVFLYQVFKDRAEFQETKNQLPVSS